MFLVYEPIEDAGVFANSLNLCKFLDARWTPRCLLYLRTHAMIECVRRE